MAYSKIILNGETLMDVTSDTVDAGNLLSGKTATKNSGAKVTGNIATKSSSDLTVSGATVTAPAGYYSAAASKSVATTTHPNPTATIASSTGVVTASHTQGTGYVTGGTTTGTLNLTTQAAQTINTSTADQTIASNRWLTGTQTIKSVTTSNLTAANIAEGVTVKVGDANNASRITQITGTHSGETQYTATIVGSGNSSYCYVTYNGTKYYSSNGTFSFKAGDTLTIYCRGNNFTINEETQALTNYSYTMTLPIGDVIIWMEYSSSTDNMIQLYTYVLPEDTYEISSSGNFNVYGYARAWVPSGAAVTPAKTITTNPTMTIASTTGVVTAAYNGSSSITPTIVSGYVTTADVTAGTVSTTGTSTFQLTSKAAATYNTSTADQTVPSYRWLTGTQTIKSVTTSNLTAANIASGVVVKVGDANNASRITQVTGTYAPTVSSLTVTPTETAQTFNATGVYGYKPVTVNAISSTYVGTGVAKKSSNDTTFASATGTFTAPIGYYSAAATKTITTQAAQTITPTKASQYINSYRWLTGSQTIAPIPASYIIPSGTSIITSNGTYDVTNYATASVSVGGGEYRDLCYAMIMTNSIYASGHSSTTGSMQFKYTSEEVVSFCNFFSSIGSRAFEGKRFCGSFTFANVSSISIYAFASAAGNTFAQGEGTIFNFPSCTFISDEAFYYNLGISEVYGSNCATIGKRAFAFCSYLTTISFPKCTLINMATFSHCNNLLEASFPLCSMISDYAFQGCHKLTSIYFPICSIISNSAFYNCISLTTINFPQLSVVGSTAFDSCFYLSSITLPNVSLISFAGFRTCSALETLTLSNLLVISNYAFAYCSSLVTVSFPKCTNIGERAFYACDSLTNVSIPSCVTVGNSAFYACSNLQMISLPSCSSLGNYAFGNCYKLLSLYLLGSSIVSISTYSVFYNTPISNYTTVTGGVYGSIYVPASLYNSYVTATNWSRYSSRFVSV